MYTGTNVLNKYLVRHVDIIGNRYIKAVMNRFVNKTHCGHYVYCMVHVAHYKNKENKSRHYNH